MMPKLQARAARPAVQPTLQTQLLQLPDAVLTSILQHVPTVDRLMSCALVCKAWASAVASTILHLETESGLPLSIVDYEGCRRIQSWLDEWGPQVASINLRCPMACNSAPLMLPCSKLFRLERLRLEDVFVEFHTQQGSISTRSTHQVRTCQSFTAGRRSSSSGDGLVAIAAASPGPDACLPQLRDLLLFSCRVELDSFQHVSKLTALTGLHLEEIICTGDICTGDWISIEDEQFGVAVSAALEHLQGLECLFLGDGIALQEQDGALAPLSTMQHLQCLTLSTDACSTDDLTHLPTSLTYLALRGAKGLLDLDLVDLAVTPESLPHLTSLRELELSCVVLDPAVLGRLSALHKLSLYRVMLPEPADEVEVSDEGEYVSLEALLAGLGQLTQLEELSLSGMELDRVQDLQLFTALTASSQLTALHLRDSYTVLLPHGALQHMLRPGRLLPHLKSLRLEVDDWAEWCVSAQDISRMAACLPALEDLSLCHVVQGRAAVAELTQLLPGLMQLHVGGNAFGDHAAALVAQLTSLQDLDWTSSNITALGMLELTALKGLTSLHVGSCPDRDELVPEIDPGGWSQPPLNLSTSEGAAAAGAPDVWLQLKQQCDDDPNCRRARLQAEQTAAGRHGPRGGKKKGTAAAKKRR